MDREYLSLACLSALMIIERDDSKEVNQKEMKAIKEIAKAFIALAAEKGVTSDDIINKASSFFNVTMPA